MPCPQLTSFKLLSPIGELIMKTCEYGLHDLHQSAINDADFHPDLTTRVSVLSNKDETPEPTNKHAKDCISWLQVYFSDANASRKIPKPKFCFSESTDKGTFRKRIWMTLAEKVDSGRTVSYGELANLAGSKGAAQAVGTAMATNPIQLIVPCHRVVRSDGSVGNYALGKKNNVKLWLLKYEGNFVNDKGCLVNVK